MSESETAEPTDQEVKLEHNPRKRIRHRKKQLYENILKQMEFYFSDANLTKDRFLGELVKTNPYVPIDVFLKFNKIRAMTQDVTDITKAMKNSSMLELSEDKLKVQRKAPLVPYDAEQRTIYVESIPVTASREWLQRVFSDYGTVAYISLPTFKGTHKIKGFGFIEFARAEDAQKCLVTFTKMGCKLPTCMNPEELSSIKMFSAEAPAEAAHDKEEKEEEPPKKKKKKEKKLKNLELKLEVESDGEKRVDTPTTPTPTEESKTITTTGEEGKTTDAESKDELTSHDEGKHDPAVPRKKKIRKRTAKERSKAKNSLGPNEAPKAALWGLQVLSKSEWKSLRNKYLGLQRKYMSNLKSSLQNKRNSYSGFTAPAAPAIDNVSAINPQDAPDAKNPEPLERIPGVYVKEVLSEPCNDIRRTKRTIRSNVHALHVDVKEGQSEAIIRFDSAKAASDYCANPSNHAHVLSSADADAQWARAEAARGSRRARGRLQLLARHDAQCARAAHAHAPASPQPTHTHIRFDDE